MRTSVCRSGSGINSVFIENFINSKFIINNCEVNLWPSGTVTEKGLSFSNIGVLTLSTDVFVKILFEKMINSMKFDVNLLCEQDKNSLGVNLEALLSLITHRKKSPDKQTEEDQERYRKAECCHYKCWSLFQGQPVLVSL